MNYITLYQHYLENGNIEQIEEFPTRDVSNQKFIKKYEAIKIKSHTLTPNLETRKLKNKVISLTSQAIDNCMSRIRYKMI